MIANDGTVEDLERALVRCWLGQAGGRMAASAKQAGRRAARPSLRLGCRGDRRRVGSG